MTLGAPVSGLQEWISNTSFNLALLTNNLAHLLMPVCGAVLLLSLAGLLIGQHRNSPDLAQRAQAGLLFSIVAGGVIYLVVAVSQYAAGLCL